MEGLQDFLTEFRGCGDFPSLQRLLSAFRSRPPAKPADGSYRPQKVFILSNYSTQFVASALPLALLQNGIWPEVLADEYDAWEITPLEEESALTRFRPDVALFLLSSLPLAYGSRSGPEEVAGRITAMVGKVRERTRARIALTLPEALADERSADTWAYRWRQEVLRLLDASLPADCARISLEPLIRDAGSRAWHADRYYVMSKLPFHPANTKAVATVLADVLADLAAPRIKLIIADLDNTLWGGTVGEVGAAKVDLDHLDKGLAHLRLQKLLGHLRESGVLLAIASKNNPEDALAVFRTRPEMILKESHFAATRINWLPKSRNVADILAELRLSTAGVVFLDDSPVEREEIRQMVPGVLVPELGPDPIAWADELLGTGLFTRRAGTAEDRSRAELYRTEQARESAKGAFRDEGEFLKSLELSLKVEGYPGNEARVLDLLAKTNQFNLTTRRHNREAVEALLARGGRCYVFGLADRFGSYGIIGVMLTVPASGGRAHAIDTWLMSCRVIGRKVERGMLAHVIGDLRDAGVRELIGELIPTGKNGMVADLYPDLGFAATHADGESRFFALPLASADPRRLGHFCAIVSGEARA